LAFSLAWALLHIHFKWNMKVCAIVVRETMLVWSTPLMLVNTKVAMIPHDHDVAWIFQWVHWICPRVLMLGWKIWRKGLDVYSRYAFYLLLCFC
jgi:hypothetical protein